MSRTLRPLMSLTRLALPVTPRSASAGAFSIARPILSPPSFSPLSIRLKSTGAPVQRSKWARKPTITYEELKPLTQQPSDDVLIIDVREPDEVMLGSIPSAVNLPLSGLKDALDENYSQGDFQKNYAFHKPDRSQNIIFFCRSGRRSATAGEQAGEKGYHNVRNYTGSWLDWEKREKEGKSGGDGRSSSGDDD